MGLFFLLFTALLLLFQVFFSTVVTETAHLIAQWMSVGFAHGENMLVCWSDRHICLYRLRSSTSGVCNTDNFSLLSITIDYGPFGFMESYNPSVYSGVCGCVIRITERPVTVRCQTEAVMLQILSPTRPMMRADTGLELRLMSGCSTWRSSWLLSFLCFLKNSRKSKKDVQQRQSTIWCLLPKIGWKQHAEQVISWTARRIFLSLCWNFLFLFFSRAKVLLKGYADIYQMRWAPGVSSPSNTSFLVLILFISQWNTSACTCCDKFIVLFWGLEIFLTLISGFISFLKRNSAFWGKKRVTATSLPSCLRQEHFYTSVC